MKRYTFRMEQVLRVRRLQEDAARAGVSIARSAERAAEIVLASSNEYYMALETPAAPAAAHSFLGQRDRGALRATGVRIAEGHLSTAVEASTAAIDEWRATHQRVEALERLDERRREEHGIELRRYEDAAADEIVVSRARSGQ